ncbi:MAG: MBOAT family protein [Planctomycetota bacterium]
MVFSSIEFLFYFLPAVVLLYALIHDTLRNALLLLASLLFYLWTGGELIALLLISIGANWLLGLFVHWARTKRQADGTRGSKRVALAITLSVLVNMGILGWFKYANFFANQLNAVAELLGGGPVAQLAAIALPIGISFYTFQATSYVIDVATGRGHVLRNPVTFALYVSLFPQLIAGPIVRFHEIEPELRSRRFTWEGVSLGGQRFAQGLIKKVLVADTVAPVADAAFRDPSSLTMQEAWIGLIAYTIQIYFDFSAYSDMAVGLGRMFGFKIPENFRRPYSAVTMTDFWRRWHITLSRWFRDYLYIPLGGSRGGHAKTYRNLIIVFVITGLWHGANWPFLLWGIYHGAWLIIDRLLGLRDTGDLRWVPLRRAATLLIAMLGWVVFRAVTLEDAGAYYLALVVPGGEGDALAEAMTPQAITALCIGSLVAFLPARRTVGQWMDAREGKALLAYRLLLCLVLLPLAVLLVVSGTFSPFLYFQF